MTCVEISDGTIDMDEDDKLEPSCARSASSYKVLSEVGSKDDSRGHHPVPVGRLDQARARGRRLEGHHRGPRVAAPWASTARAATSRTACCEEIRTTFDTSQILFEAPIKKQQAWFIKQFGTNVNLGNIPPEEVISVETLRVGVRGDTLLTFH